MSQQVRFTIPIDGRVNGHLYRQSAGYNQRVRITDINSGNEVNVWELGNNDSVAIAFAGLKSAEYLITIQYNKGDGAWKGMIDAFSYSSVIVVDCLVGLTLQGGKVEVVGGFNHLAVAGEDFTDKDFNDTMLILFWLNRL
jgi:hypothetical protein